MVKGILVNRKSDEMLKNQMKMEHADLIAEMQTVENLPTHERLQLARLRRAQQLKMARQKEKEWLKMQRAKGNPIACLNGGGSTSTTTTHHFRTSTGRHIAFENSVVLLEAASRNDMQEVAELLQHGITPDAANEDGLTALHQCCIDNNVEMLKLLLQYGANVDAQDSDKWTPLHAAATCGHLELVRILIEHGANLLAVNTDGNMPYDLCDDENTLDFIEAEMSKRGVTQELIDETRSSTEKQMLRDLMEIARNGSDLEEPYNQGATPLHIAAANGYTRVVEFLLEMHVNVDALDKDLWSPVHAAACWGHLEVLEMLAQCGADLNVKNKDDETPSDICEDPEIRERIEQLKTEQESKRLAEAQRRRVRRSQSNNTRAQSVRRTSLRDKTLTTKKDAVEEARLRLQAQEVFTVPDSTTVELSPNGSATNAAYEHNEELVEGGGSTSSTTNEHQQLKRHSNEMNGGIHWSKMSGSGGGSSTATTHHNNNIITTNNNNNNNNDKKSYNASLALNNGSAAHLPHSISADAVDAHRHSYTIPRRPPDGRENDELLLNTYKINGSDVNEHRRSTSSSVAAVVLSERNASSSSSAAEAVQIQSSKDAANGKINVQVTVLVDTTNTHHHLHNATSQLPLQHNHQQQQLETSATFSGATLANLKKQRSQSRTCVLNENGSVLGAVTNNTTSTTNNNNNNSIDSTETMMVSTNQPMGAGINPALMDYGGMASGSEMNSSYSVNKFSGVTGDVVSDSTSSKKCCIVM